MNDYNKTPDRVCSLLGNYSLVLSLGLLATITFASLSPRGSSGDPGAVGISDSAAHVMAYASVVFFRAATPSATLFWLSLAVFGWSIVIEILQPLTGRSANLLDIFANAIGVIVGLLIGHLFRVLLLRFSTSSS